MLPTTTGTETTTEGETATVIETETVTAGFMGTATAMIAGIMTAIMIATATADMTVMDDVGTDDAGMATGGSTRKLMFALSEEPKAERAAGVPPFVSKE